MLVERKFGELAQVGSGSGLSAVDMQEAVNEIGTSLVMPPERMWEELDITAVAHVPGRYFVVFDLWTARGRSDWSIELTIDGTSGKPRVDVDNIHMP